VVVEVEDHEMKRLVAVLMAQPEDQAAVQHTQDQPVEQVLLDKVMLVEIVPRG